MGDDIDGEAVNDYSGDSVSISSDGTRVAIGAHRNDGAGSKAGHVRVYVESGGTWTQVGDDIDGEAANDNLGYSVSISSDGTRVAIGVLGGGDSNAGHVCVYEESGGTWTKVGDDIDGEAANDYSGDSVSISSDGTRVAIGARRNDVQAPTAGHVRVYSESGGTWTQVGDDINGETVDDRSGYSVSMSSDGTRVAIGAVRNDGSADGSAGHVRVYKESGGTWTKVGDDIDGEAAKDYSGWSVSISSDGTRVAIGAPRNDGTGAFTDAGHVRVFSLSCDASTTPTNGAVGDCTDVLASGSTCQPTCNSGYVVSGTSSCTAGTLTAATCSLKPCDASAAPGTNGGYTLLGTARAPWRLHQLLGERVDLPADV